MENVSNEQLLEGIEERIRQSKNDMEYHARKYALAKIDNDNWTKHKESLANGADYGL